jgi:hypothetical protein
VLSAVVVYALASRYGAWTWLAVLAALPPFFVTGVGTAGTRPAVPALATAATALVAARLFRTSPPRGRHTVLSALVLVLALAAGVLSGVLSDTSQTPGSPAAGLLLLLPAVLLGTAAAAGLGRARPSQVRGVTALALLLPCAAALGATTTQSHPLASRVVALTAVAWWPLAGALGLTALLRGRRGRATERPQLDEVDRAAIADFDHRYATPELAPVALVIAAYDEERGLPAVLGSLPGSVCGLPADVLVVDDGSSDDTAGVVARDPGAYLVRCGTNRGQGAALRLGYRVAREHGARYLLTTDADGQYDPGDLPAVLAPLLEDRADFVTGSRRLGQQHSRDRVRRAGVRVFAGIVSVLVGQRVTDTSFGLRGMRAEVTAAVTLNQVQYQSSELLIGAFSHGFRVLEVPGTMHLRNAGSSKKGRNLVYGRRYAGVVLGTWWREGCPRPVTETARALAEPAGTGEPARASHGGPGATTAA